MENKSLASLDTHTHTLFISIEITLHDEIFIRAIHLKCCKLENEVILSQICNWMILLSSALYIILIIQINIIEMTMMY